MQAAAGGSRPGGRALWGASTTPAAQACAAARRAWLLHGPCRQQLPGVLQLSRIPVPLQLGGQRPAGCDRRQQQQAARGQQAALGDALQVAPQVVALAAAGMSWPCAFRLATAAICRPAQAHLSRRWRRRRRRGRRRRGAGSCPPRWRCCRHRQAALQVNAAALHVWLPVGLIAAGHHQPPAPGCRCRQHAGCRQRQRQRQRRSSTRDARLLLLLPVLREWAQRYRCHECCDCASSGRGRRGSRMLGELSQGCRETRYES